jgi:uncharacterized protein YoxC
MEPWSVGILIMGIAVLIAAVAAVPALLQLKKTLKSAEVFNNEINARLKNLLDNEVKPLIRSINIITDEVGGVVKAAKEGVEKIDDALDAVKGVGDTVRSINNIINTRVKGTLIDIVAYAVGLKSGLGFLVDQAKAFKKKEVA